MTDPVQHPAADASDDQPAAERLRQVRNRSLWTLAGLCVAALLVWLLSPILAPFIIAAGLAYVGDPLVDRLEALRLPRTVGVTIVFAGVTIVSILVLLLMAPMLQDQFVSLAQRIPDMAAYVQNQLLPSIGINLPERFSLDIEGLRNVVTENWSKAGGVAGNLWSSVSASTGKVLAFAANLLLIPVVAFYLLRDWDVIVERTRALVPPRYLPTVDSLATETDEVLSEFIRGQLLVMTALMLIYVLGLWAVGLELALLIGLIAGLISFVPYLGVIVGISLATLAMLLQGDGWLPLLGVWVVFGIGQIVESAVLTPLLVGDRIGLHPVAVIFAVLAGGQLFGFVGVLLALPVAAALAVLIRFALRQWLASGMYLDDAPPADTHDAEETLLPEVNAADGEPADAVQP